MENPPFTEKNWRWWHENTMIHDPLWVYVDKRNKQIEGLNDQDTTTAPGQIGHNQRAESSRQRRKDNLRLRSMGESPETEE